MVQFYFLSIVLNILGGLILAADKLGNAFSIFRSARDYLEEKPTLKLGFALFAIIVGILKLLSATKGDVKVVGDLLPVLAGWLVGVIFFLEYYSLRNESDAEITDQSSNFLIRNKSIFGIGCAVVGAVHFLLPGVLFL